MKLRQTRYLFGSIILGCHFLGMLLYFAFGSSRYTDFSEVIQGVLTLTPLTAIYTTLFVKYVAANPIQTSEEDGRAIGKDAFLVQGFIIIFFCMSLIGGMIYLFLSGVINYGNIRTFTGLLDTVFSGYLATIFGKLFPNNVLGDNSSDQPQK